MILNRLETPQEVLEDLLMDEDDNGESILDLDPTSLATYLMNGFRAKGLRLLRIDL